MLSIRAFRGLSSYPDEMIPLFPAGPFSGIMGYFCVAVIDK